MDSSKLIDSLDSLWFFSNVFTSSTMEKQQVDVVVVDDDGPGPGPVTITQPEKEDTDEIEQNNESPDGENPVRIMCHKCGDFAAEIESVKEEVEEKKKMRRAARRRRRTRTSRRRRVFGELDLGFYGQMKSPPPLVQHNENDESPPWLLDDFQTTFEFSAQHYVNMKKMPPLNDGLAMKQHLKSWAYAVACTVR